RQRTRFLLRGPFLLRPSERLTFSRRKDSLCLRWRRSKFNKISGLLEPWRWYYGCNINVAPAELVLVLAYGFARHDSGSFRSRQLDARRVKAEQFAALLSAEV